jgi:hypothetical protein
MPADSSIDRPHAATGHAQPRPALEMSAVTLQTHGRPNLMSNSDQGLRQSIPGPVATTHPAVNRVSAFRP